MNKLKRNLTVIIDIAFALLIGISFLIDFYCFKNVMDVPAYTTKFVYSDIVVASLLSITITVISILIAFPKNELYGIPLRDIQKILNKRYYSLLHLFVDSCLIFALNLIFKFCDYRFSGQMLEALTIIMCFIFGIQQFDLLLETKKSGLILISLNFKECCFNAQTLISSEGELVNFAKANRKEKSATDIYFRLLENYILTEGIEQTFIGLRKVIGSSNDNKLIEILLSYQDNYFFNLKEFINSENNTDRFEKYNGILISNSIKVAYENVSFITLNRKYCFMDKDWATVSQSTLYIHKVVNLLKYNEFEERCLKESLARFFSYSERCFCMKLRILLHEICEDKSMEDLKHNSKSLALDSGKLKNELSRFEKTKIKDLKDDDRRYFANIFSAALDDFDRYYQNITLYLSYITMNTIKDDDVSFLNFYDSNFHFSLFNEETNPYRDFSFFISFIILYLLDNVNGLEPSNIKSLINKVDKSYLSYRSWKQMFVDYFNTALSSDDLVNIWKRFTHIYDDYNLKMIGMIDGKIVELIGTDAVTPAKEVLFKYWFGCVCIYYDFDEEKLTKFVKDLISLENPKNEYKDDTFEKAFKLTQIGVKNDKSYFYFLSFVLDYKVTTMNYETIKKVLDGYENKIGD